MPSWPRTTRSVSTRACCCSATSSSPRTLDKLGYDEFWVGEHHSSGWEMIASPELFLAAAGERTQRIKLGTGVVSLPYHHPFNVCQRMVQLDHMTGGRVIFGTGPGALPSDARTHGIAPNLLRDRQDEGIGVCIRLLVGRALHAPQRLVRAERRRAADPPAAGDDADGRRVEHQPVGHDARGQVRHRRAVDRVDVDRRAHGVADAVGRSRSRRRRSTDRSSNRADWRVLMAWHIAETKDQAIEEAALGLQRWHNEYNVKVLGRPGAELMPDAYEMAAAIANGDAAQGAGTGIIGTPDDAIARDPVAARDRRRLRRACSGSHTTGRTARRRCAAGTCSRAT